MQQRNYPRWTRQRPFGAIGSIGPAPGSTRFEPNFSSRVNAGAKRVVRWRHRLARLRPAQVEDLIVTAHGDVIAGGRGKRPALMGHDICLPRSKNDERATMLELEEAGSL